MDEYNASDHMQHHQFHDMQEGSEPNPSTTIRDDGKAIIVYQGSQPEYNTHLGITVQHFTVPESPIILPRGISNYDDLFELGGYWQDIAAEHNHGPSGTSDMDFPPMQSQPWSAPYSVRASNHPNEVGKGCIDTNVLAETTTAEALPGTSNVKEDQGSQHPDTMEIKKGLAYCSEGVTTIQNWCENISERIQEVRAMLASSKKRKERSSSQTLRTPPFALDLSGTSPEEDIMKGKTTHASAGGGSSSGREATSQRLYPNLKSYIVWVDVKGRLPVRLTGNQIKMGILKPVELDSNIIAATVRLLSEFERNMILHRSNGASRHYIPPEWTSYVTAGNFEAHISEQYFKNSPTGYDLTTCNMLLAPVRFGQGWSCYAINVPESTLTVMDPFLKADAGNIRIQWHQITARKVLEEAIRCFDIVRSVDTAETTKWKVNIQLLTEVKCCTWDTGIYTMTCMRWYEPEVDVSIIRLDERTAYEARKQLAHDLINMECNHAQLPHRLPTST